MTLRSAALLLVALASGAAWLACQGDDPVSSGEGGVPVGAFGGRCFDDGTCKEGLSCDAEALVCRNPLAPVEGGAGAADGANGDGAAIDAEAGDGCGAKLLPSGTPGVPCPGNGAVTACSGQFVCCLAEGSEDPCLDINVACGGVIWMCSSPSDCGQNEHCCLDGPDGGPTQDTCGSGWKFQGGAMQTQCRASCGTKERDLCDNPGTKSDCPDEQQCVRARATLGGTDVLLNACVP